MTCMIIEHGYICGPDEIVDLTPYGSKVWLSWHHYTGPVFYRSENMIKPIVCPSKKTWDAFGKWRNWHVNCKESKKSKEE